MKKSITQLLRAVRNEPSLGKLSKETKDSTWLRVEREIEQMSAPAVRPTVFDYLRGPFHGMELRAALRPVTALGVLMSVALGGVGSVFASMNSVPGDTLYGLKIAAEKAQLTLADSDEMRARLHVEFANRRADEVSQLLESKHPNHEERVKVAMGNLKEELQSVSNKLSDLKGSDKQTALSLAKLVDRKVNGLEQTIEASLEGATDAVKQEAEQVKDAVKVAGIAAQDVLKAKAEEVGAKLEATGKRLLAVQAAVELRLARLPILSETDRAMVADLKMLREQIDEAQVKLDEKDVAGAEKIESEVASKLDAVKVEKSEEPSDAESESKPVSE